MIGHYFGEFSQTRRIRQRIVAGDESASEKRVCKEQDQNRESKGDFRAVGGEPPAAEFEPPLKPALALLPS